MNFRLQTREDYVSLLDRFLTPFQRYYSSTSSTITIGDEQTPHYGIKISTFETFSRSLIGLCLLDGYENTKETVMKMIDNGVNKECNTYWGDIYDDDQKIVECFPILLFCYRNRQLFETAFSSKSRKNFEEWFNQINNVRVANNNWQFFIVLTNILLKELELDYDKNAIDLAFSNINNNYLGNGWYKDGQCVRMDYYIPFAFHFYSLLYLLINPTSNLRATIIDRANQFSKTFLAFFADSGESIPFGRSLTYKFAHISFWSIWTNFITDTKEIAIIKGIINRNLRWWLTQSIFDKEGFLVNGYSYSNSFLLETYNAKGSPYWAMKAFFMLWGENQNFFDAIEKPFPTINHVTPIDEANMIIFRDFGHPFMFVNGQNAGFNTWAHSKYEKFVYSSLFGFCHGRDGDTIDFLAPDNTIAIKIRNSLLVRKNAIKVENTEHFQTSDWNVLPGISIRTCIIPSGAQNVRIHFIRTKHSFTLYDFAYSINQESLSETILRNGFSKCVSGKLFSSIEELSHKGKGKVCNCKPNVHVYYPLVSIPYLMKQMTPGFHIITTLVDGGIMNNCDNKIQKKYSISFFLRRVKINAIEIRIPLLYYSYHLFHVHTIVQRIKYYLKKIIIF